MKAEIILSESEIREALVTYLVSKGTNVATVGNIIHKEDGWFVSAELANKPSKPPVVYRGGSGAETLSEPYRRES